MKNIGKVLATFSANKNQSGLPRPKVESLKLINGYGIENDKFAGKDEQKSVMIIGINSYTLAKNSDIVLDYGSYGENILFDFDPHLYPIGTCFVVNQSEFIITEKCTICNHLAIFGKALPKLVKDCRGLYCKILKDGIITKDMEVFIKE